MLRKLLVMLPFLLAAIAAPAHAQSTFPSKPIKFIVPAPPGGASDALARLIGEKLTARWGQPVVIESKPGASGVIGGDLVAKSPPDGYTILMISGLHTSTPHFMAKLPYDPLKDFEAVAMVAASPMILQVHPDTPANSVADLLALARAKPGQLSFGSSGAGSPSHLAGERFTMMSNTNIMHVPYKGAGQAITDLLGNHMTLMFNNPLSTMQLVNSGKLKALAVTSKNRMSVLPNVPTVAETGFPGFEVTSWWGVLAPAKVPREIVTTLNSGINAVLVMSEMKQKFAALGAEPLPESTRQFASFMAADMDIWARIVKQRGIRPE